MEYGGEWYRKIEVSGKKGTYDDYYLHDGSKVENGRTYYLRYEPVKWITKELKTGETLAISEKTFGSVQYVGDLQEVRKKGDVTIANNDYRYSVMRSYINDINGREEFGSWGWDFSRSGGKGLGSLRFFLNEKERNILKPYDKCFGDKVFIPSKEECEEFLTEEQMKAEGTDDISVRKASETTKTVSYATRTSGGGTDMVICVNNQGEFFSHTADTSMSYRLAIRVK